MKLNILLPSLLTAFASLTASAALEVPSSSISMVEGMIDVNIDFDLKSIPVKSNQVLVVRPYLVNGVDSLYLKTIAVYGRNRFIQHERGNDKVTPAPDIVFRTSNVPATYRYHEMVENQPWMDGATLSVASRLYGCASCPDGEPFLAENLTLWRAPKLNTSDAYEYVAAQAEAVKVRVISGRANVEFPVNKTVLLPDFRGNAAELAKITASIDSVRNDKDVTIESISITGFASPEGSYANNKRLAEGRTASLCNYVETLYAFPKGLIKLASVPEDWDGLREWVEQSNIANRDAILAIIGDKALAPDARDQKIKRSFPNEYAFLLANVYPTLRHSDYRIQYTVRSYSNPQEILEIMKTRPGNLSLNELYLAAATLEPGSPEFNEVYEVAVRLYPDDPVANLNAANTAMQRGDIANAEKYLAKAGDSPEATHSRGVLALIKGDYDSAEQLLGSSLAKGIGKSKGLLDQIDQLHQYNASKTKKN